MKKYMNKTLGKRLIFLLNPGALKLEKYSEIE